jgi:hypothetical protein
MVVLEGRWQDRVVHNADSQQHGELAVREPIGEIFLVLFSNPWIG